MTLALFHEMPDCPSKRWILFHLDYTPKDFCLIWPFSRKGGGYASISGDGLLVHRIMCEARNGPPPTPEHHAAHSCERGHDGCVNSWHLDWKTPSENQLDRYTGKPVAPSAKLNAEKVAEIRALNGLEHAETTAERYGVSESNVRLIWAGKTWRSDRRDRRIFTADEVREIRSASPHWGAGQRLAEKYGVGHTTIWRIRERKTYSYVEDIPADGAKP